MTTTAVKSRVLQLVQLVLAEINVKKLIFKFGTCEHGPIEIVSDGKDIWYEIAGRRRDQEISDRILNHVFVTQSHA